jgi:hypothetical protein
MDKDVFTIYSLNGGRAMELSVNIHKRKRVLRRGVLESDLDFGDENRRDFCVSRALFLRIMGATNGFDMENVYGAMENGEALRIPKTLVHAALQQELDREKIKAMAEFANGEYEGDDYYDYGLLIRGFNRYCNGEIGGEYFAEWCHVCAFCFQHMKGIDNSRLYDAYKSLGDLFDTLAYFHRPSTKSDYEAWRKEYTARFRYENFKIECAKNRKTERFTTNGVATYVTFGFFVDNATEEVMRVLVMDEEKKRLNCFYTPPFVYDDEINYSFVSADEMDKILYNRHDYKLDRTMKVTYAKGKK